MLSAAERSRTIGKAFVDEGKFDEINVELILPSLMALGHNIIISHNIFGLSSGLGSEFGLTPGLLRPIGESETKGTGAEEGGSNLMR